MQLNSLFVFPQLYICVQINGPQEEIEAAAAMLDKWQPLDAYGNKDQGFAP